MISCNSHKYIISTVSIIFSEIFYLEIYKTENLRGFDSVRGSALVSLLEVPGFNSQFSHENFSSRFQYFTSFSTSDELKNRWTNDFYQFQNFNCSIQRFIHSIHELPE